ncbi:MAG TPA: FAD-binding protein [Burkholderiaceae bacterium]|nr:FAD-binding protein [Burkholderiaceae bacterium]
MHDIPPLDGDIRNDPASLSAAATDFGQLVRRTPRYVVRPGSEHDISRALRWAAARQYPVAPQGRRHSVFGRSLVERGMVIDLTSLRAVSAVQGDQVIVEAGATWTEVLAATLPHGLAPAVLPDYLGLSVGGTLAVGGVGGTTSRFGLVTDNVTGMRVVTGDGTLLECSPDREPELFDALRAGLGQVGVITRASLRLVPAPRQVRRLQLVYANLDALLADQRLLAEDPRFDAVQGAAVATPRGWSFRLDIVKGMVDSMLDDERLLAGLSDERARARIATMPNLEYLGRLNALEQALRANGQWQHPHPWLTTFIGGIRAPVFVAEELAKLRPEDLGPFGQVVMSAFRRDAVHTPLIRLPAEPVVHAFNLIRVPDTPDRARAERLVADNRRIYQRLRDAGGTLYPVSAMPMSQDDWRRHFGPAFTALQAARRRFDPAGLLTPGYELFRDRRPAATPNG